MTDIKQTIDYVRAAWVGSAYYANAENWTHIFWDDSTLFRRLFNRLDLTDTVELACGHGRHAARSAPLAGRLTLIDVIEDNLAACRLRLQDCDNVSYILGEGASFTGVADASLSAIYCYDAMVHFAPEVVALYLADTARVLKAGGMALYHHSNYPGGAGKNWAQNPHARNLMTCDRFAALARTVGLQVVEQAVLPWGGVADLDGVTLVCKP